MADKRSNIIRDLQAAIYQALITHAPLENELGQDRIYDTVPDEETFPYIVIGEDDIDRFDTHDFYGFKGLATIYIYDQNQGRSGRRKLKGIMHHVYEALHDVDLGLANRKQLEFACSRQTVNTEDDNKTHEGIMEFNFTFGGLDL